jgi:hypothetical protein
MALAGDGASDQKGVSPPTTERLLAGCLDELWSSSRVGLSVSVLNALVAAYVAAAKPTAPFRQLPLSTTVTCLPVTTVGQELIWMDSELLFTTALPVPAAGQPVVRERALQSGGCYADPSNPHRLLVLPAGGRDRLAEYDLKTGESTPVLLKSTAGSPVPVHRLPAPVESCAVDRVGRVYVCSERGIWLVDRRSQDVRLLTGCQSGGTSESVDSADLSRARFRGLADLCVVRMDRGSSSSMKRAFDWSTCGRAARRPVLRRSATSSRPVRYRCVGCRLSVC